MDVKITEGIEIFRCAPPAPGLELACSVARTLEQISDSWTLLVTREAFFGVRRFQDFHDKLGIPKATLADRLAGLTQGGIFKQVAYAEAPERFEYRLTAKGIDLYAVKIALMKWGDEWLLEPGEKPPVRLFHKSCGAWCEPIIACSSCLGELHARDVDYAAGPGAGWEASKARKRNRRTSNEDHLLRGRRCSVARTLAIIGDRWSFLVLREALFGVKRFDEMRLRLNIATNILSDRLRRLLAAGIFERVAYSVRPERHEYRLTNKGRALYCSMAVMFGWGDRWLAGKEGPPLITTHRLCGDAYTPVVMCNHCSGELKAWDMSYECTYDA